MKDKPQDKNFLNQANLDRFCIDHAGVAIYQISEETGRILSVNRQACLDLGYSKEELLNMSIFELDTKFLKGDVKKWRHHRDSIKKKGGGTIESMHRRKDGSLFPVEVSITYINLHENPIAFSFVQNITKRKNAENALKKSEKLFRTTLYSIGDGVIACDSKGNIRNINKVAEELTGWKEEDAKGKPIETIFRIINEFSRDPVVNPVKKVLKEGQIVGLANHTLLISREGREIPIADSGAPIFNEEGKIIGVVLVFRDQTEERHYQRELEKSRNHLETLMNNLPGMAFRCENSPSWDMKYVSKGSEELTGYKPEELIRNPEISFSDLIAEDDKNRVWETVQNAIQKNESYQVEYRIITKEGRKKWVWEKGEAVFLADRSIDVIEGFITDISERKQFEAKMEENDRLKTAFLQNVSHEIRTPMNAVLGFSELIKMEGLTKKEKNEYLDIIQANGQKLLSILNNVLELSKIETGDIKITTSRFKLNDLFNEMLSIHTIPAQSKGLELIFANTESNNVTIYSDYTKLDQILTNLINNAIKYTDKGKIEMGYSKQKNYILFFVKDTGIGISKTQQKKVFERFYRSNDPKTRSHEGVGLGLSICLGLINKLDGEIWLDSEPGKGTNFFFSLPIG
ncbi:PAS domain S-box protein [Thermophagus sp. OGC60D27]|uniref:PAS domain S-box protein n=1 Tax=Thermophagus sp. OGC60D27 TaxID=3458415 RepID=UPI0040380ED0